MYSLIGEGFTRAWMMVNTCYGGFSLSLEGIKEYLSRKGKEAFFYIPKKGFPDREYIKISNDLGDRHNTLFSLVVTKDLGEICTTLDNEKDIFSSDEIERNDKDLVDIVKKLGKKANGACADLKVVKIPDGIKWEIEEYDGLEHIAQKHKTWS